MTAEASDPNNYLLDRSIKSTEPMRQKTPQDIALWAKISKMDGLKDALDNKGLNDKAFREAIRELASQDGEGNTISEGGGSSGACVCAFVISMFCTLAVIGLFAGIIKAMKVHRNREERDRRRGWWAMNKGGG